MTPTGTPRCACAGHHGPILLPVCVFATAWSAHAALLSDTCVNFCDPQLSVKGEMIRTADLAAVKSSWCIFWAILVLKTHSEGDFRVLPQYVPCCAEATYGRKGSAVSLFCSGTFRQWRGCTASARQSRATCTACAHRAPWSSASSCAPRRSCTSTRWSTAAPMKVMPLLSRVLP